MGAVDIRAAAPHHRSLVLDAFQRSYRKNNPYCDGVSPGIVIPKMDTLLDRGWLVFVASPTGRDDSILGFIVFSRPNRIAWLHVKRVYRSAGVARALWTAAALTAREIETPFMTPEALKLAQKAGIVLRFRPYIPEIEAEAAAMETANKLASEMPSAAPWEGATGARRLTRSSFDDEADTARSAGDMVASIRRLLQWRVEGLERTCKTRPPDDDESDRLIKLGHALLRLDNAAAKVDPLDRPLSQLTDAELAAKVGF